MADDADMANAKMEMELEFLLRLPRKFKEPPQEGGTCLWCGEEIASDRRWCGPECRDDWQKYSE